MSRARPASSSAARSSASCSSAVRWAWVSSSRAASVR
jgi:hypothetical protein